MKNSQWMLSLVLVLVLLMPGIVEAQADVPIDNTATMEAAPMENTVSTAVEYGIDSVHSTIGFGVKHLQISTTRGKFADYTGTIIFDPEDYSVFNADITIQVASIDTDNEKRDNHLRGPDFFDAEQFPVITFKSNRLEKRGEGQVIVGDLTIKDVTKQLTIPVQIIGPAQNPFGEGQILGLTVQTVINRKDFNITWSKTLDNGGEVVGEMVDISVELELHEK